jgi:hypothetical protein
LAAAAGDDSLLADPDLLARFGFFDESQTSSS